MISRSGPRCERSPPLASGWWRFTSSLNRALISVRGRVRLEAQRVERLALGIADRCAARASAVGVVAGAADVAKQAERIVGACPA